MLPTTEVTQSPSKGAISRLGSFKAAATELAVTPTAVSHQIRALEAQTGLALFDRQVRKVALTEAGAQLFPVLRDGFDAFEATLARLTQPRTRVQVSISATNAFTVKWLVPRMSDFRSQHPGIDLQLQASDELADLRSTAVDIAIRYGRGPYPGLVTQPLFTDRFAPVANPRLGVTSPADLARVPLIRFDWKQAHPENPTWERWFAVARLPQPQQASQLRFSDEGHAIQAEIQPALNGFEYNPQLAQAASGSDTVMVASFSMAVGAREGEATLVLPFSSFAQALNNAASPQLSETALAKLRSPLACRVLDPSLRQP